MSLAPSASILRVKEGYIYGWSGNKSLTASALTLLDYTNPADYFLTRIMLGIDWSGIGAGESLSYTIQVDGISMFTEKIVTVDFNLGSQPKMFEFVIPPNSQVKILAAEDSNNGGISAMLTGYKI